MRLPADWLDERVNVDILYPEIVHLDVESSDYLLRSEGLSADPDRLWNKDFVAFLVLCKRLMKGGGNELDIPTYTTAPEFWRE